MSSYEEDESSRIKRLKKAEYKRKWRKNQDEQSVSREREYHRQQYLKRKKDEAFVERKRKKDAEYQKRRRKTEVRKPPTGQRKEYHHLQYLKRMQDEAYLIKKRERDAEYQRRRRRQRQELQSLSSSVDISNNQDFATTSLPGCLAIIKEEITNANEALLPPQETVYIKVDPSVSIYSQDNATSGQEDPLETVLVKKEPKTEPAHFSDTVEDELFLKEECLMYDSAVANDRIS